MLPSPDDHIPLENFFRFGHKNYDRVTTRSDVLGVNREVVFWALIVFLFMGEVELNKVIFWDL